MKTIKLPYGTTYLLLNNETEIQTDKYFIQEDEYGQFFAINKSNSQEIHIPRTTAISSMTIEASRFSNGATKFGQEVHKQTEQGEKNAYNRTMDLNKALYKEVRFIHIGKILFTGTIDLVFEKYIADIKTGKPSSSYYYQMLGYAYALGYKFAELHYFNQERGNWSERFYFMDENYHKWEYKYNEWVNTYNAREKIKEKEVIQVWKNENDNEELTEQVKEYARTSRVYSYINKRMEGIKEKYREKLCMYLQGKKLEIRSSDGELTTVSVVGGKSKPPYLKVNSNEEATFDEIKEVMGMADSVEDYKKEIESLVF